MEHSFSGTLCCYIHELVAKDAMQPRHEKATSTTTVDPLICHREGRFSRQALTFWREFLRSCRWTSSLWKIHVHKLLVCKVWWLKSASTGSASSDLIDTYLYNKKTGWISDLQKHPANFLVRRLQVWPHAETFPSLPLSLVSACKHRPRGPWKATMGQEYHLMQFPHHFCRDEWIHGTQGWCPTKQTLRLFYARWWQTFMMIYHDRLSAGSSRHVLCSVWITLYTKVASAQVVSGIHVKLD